MKGMCDMELKKVDKKVEDIKSNNNIYSFLQQKQNL